MRGASVASKVAGVLIVAGVLFARPAVAAPIAAHVVGCVGDSCTAAPDGGPVSIDPDGFTLDVFWGPGFIALTEAPAAAKVPEPEIWALIAVAAVAIIVRQVRRLRRPAARIQ